MPDSTVDSMPDPQQTAQKDDLARMIAGMVRYDQRLPEEALPITVRK
jgi:hypothetical protein